MTRFRFFSFLPRGMAGGTQMAGCCRRPVFLRTHRFSASPTSTIETYAMALDLVSAAASSECGAVPRPIDPALTSVEKVIHGRCEDLFQAHAGRHTQRRRRRSQKSAQSNISKSNSARAPFGWAIRRSRRVPVRTERMAGGEWFGAATSWATAGFRVAAAGHKAVPGIELA